MTSDALPWLMVHGDVAWPLATAAAASMGFGLTWLATHRTARRAAELARADLGPPSDVARARAGQRVTLEGELDLRGPSAELRVGPARVGLDGSLNVLAGSRERWAGGRALGRELASGDRVRAAGVLIQDPSDDAASYREAGKRLRLTNSAMAFLGTPRAVPADRCLAARAIAAGLAFVVVVLGAGGLAARSVGFMSMTIDRTGDAPPSIELTLASASPFTRSEVLRDYARVLDLLARPSPVALARREKLHELLGQPLDTAAMWIEQGDPARGATLALDYGDRPLAARGYYAAGDFMRAADAWPFATNSSPIDEVDLRFAIGVNLLAHRYGRASEAARMLARQFETEAKGRTPEGKDRWFFRRAAAATCLADALEAKGGGKAMPYPEASAPRACALLALDGLDGQARLEAAKELSIPSLETESHDVPLTWFTLLKIEAGACPPSSYSGSDEALRELVVPNGEEVWRTLPGVQRELAERIVKWQLAFASNESPALRNLDALACTSPPRPRGPSSPLVSPSGSFLAGISKGAAVFARLAGDRRAVDRLLAGVGPTSGNAYLDVSAALALPEDSDGADIVVAEPNASREPRALAMLHGLRDLVVEHDAAELVRQLAANPPPDEDVLVAWKLAATGDADALTEWLEVPSHQVGPFLRYVPAWEGPGKETLARWIRHGYRAVRPFHPIEALVQLAAMAEAARRLGDEATAKDLDERTRRFREAVLDRDTSVLLAVLERL